MALLNPIANCKITDANAFYVSLEGTLSSSHSGSNFSYGSPVVFSKGFSRNETLKRAYIQISSTNRTNDGLNFNVSLCKFSSVTVTSASPTVVTWTAHGLATGQKVRFAGTTIPTGMTKGIAYYINVQTANTFWIYDTYANAIAGGATGRVNTTSTGTGVVCYSVLAEQTTSVSALTNSYYSNFSGTTETVIVNYLWDVDYAVTTTGSWAYMISTDDATRTISTAGIVIASFGSTTATAVSGTDNMVIGHSVDFSSGWTWAGYSHLCYNQNSDTWLNPNVLVDPSASSLANMTLNATSGFVFSTRAGFSFGKPLRFTSQLSTGDTSATLTTAFTGTTGSHILQLFPRTNSDDFVQISASFTNGSTAVTFSALTFNATDKGAICFKQASPYAINLNTSSTLSQISQADMALISFFAEEPREMYAYTTAETSAGATSMTVDRNTGWASGDKFVMGGQKTKHASMTDMSTEYTISTVTPGAGTDTITFSPAISATFDRASGATVSITTFSSSALSVVRTTGSSSIGFNANSFTCLNLCGISSRFLTGGGNAKWVVDSNVMPYYIYKTIFYGTAIVAPKQGAYYEDIAFNSGSFFTIAGIQTLVYDTSTYVRDIAISRMASFPASIASTYPINIKNITADGFITSGGLFTFSSEGYSIDNLKIWNGALGGSGFTLSSCFNGDIQNVYVDNCSYGITINSGKCLVRNLYLGSTYANTYDINFSNSGGFSQIELQNFSTTPTVDITNRAVNMSATGYLALTKIGGVDNNVRLLYKYGESTITGTGLADTTTRIGNNQLMFQSYSGINQTSWTQTIPTGDIQDRDMMIGVWVKISNSAYYAGTHQMPRLTINYDNGTEVYAEASQTTDWQYIFVPFTPTTTYGSVTAKLSIKSDATFANTKVYYGDMSVLYPAGYTLNLGAFNYLSAGLPVTPTISTSVSAQDVWSADPTQFGTSTVGDKVNKIKNDTGIIPALL